MRDGHPRPPRRLTPADLKGAALDYLDRFAATRARLRQVMLRKIRNSVRAHGDDPAPIMAALDETIQWLEAQRFPQRPGLCRSARPGALSARGTSRAHILANLASKGVESEDRARGGRWPADGIRGAGVGGRAALCAAPAPRPLSRRGARAECRNKDLAAMARAGFAGRIARQVIDSEREA